MNGPFFLLILGLLALHVSAALTSFTDGAAADAGTLLLLASPSGRRLLNRPASASTAPSADERKNEKRVMVERPKMELHPSTGTGRGMDQEINGDDNLLYNVDYHGVETHPSPLPRHPKP